MASSCTALNVVELYDAQAAETSIHRLVSVINAQASRISELQESVHLMQATQDQMLADYKALHTVVAPLCPYVKRLDRDISNLKQFLPAAHCQLESIACQLRSKADHQEAQDMEVRSNTRLEHVANGLRNELASMQLVQCLQKDQSGLHDKLEMIEKRVAAKMDKSEATRLDGVLIQIHEFRPMVTQLSTRIKDLQTQLYNLSRSVAYLDTEQEARTADINDTRQHVNGLQEMLASVEKRHDCSVAPQLHRLDLAFEQLQQSLSEVKTAATTSETTLRTLSAKFHSSATAVAAQLQQQHRHFENLLHEKAVRTDTETQLADLRRQIATKASDKAYKTVSSSVKDLRTCCDELWEHVRLSTRFMDWFARRGEAYEHNLELVETQLGRLAQASHPQGREPFGEHVRFPRSL